MNRVELLDNLVSSGNGYLLTSQVLSNGISKPTLADYVAKRKMERVARGIYLSADAWSDHLYELYRSCPGIVFSHETALYLHGLMEREPRFTTVTVKAGYNASHLRKKGIRVVQVKEEVVDLGVTEVRTNFGNPVHAYDADRTICDMIRYKDKTDIQIFQYALKEYMTGDQKNLNHLMSYAKALHVEEAVRTYTEVML